MKKWKIIIDNDICPYGEADICELIDDDCCMETCPKKNEE